MFREILEKTLQSKIDPVDIYIAHKVTFFIDTENEYYEEICIRIKQIVQITNENIEHILDRACQFIEEFGISQFVEMSIDYIIGEIESIPTEV